MLTGDNEKTAAAIAKKAGIDEVTASVKPGEKEAVINKLKEFGKVAMVGDGINDAPALTSADIGIAIGAGSDIAIDAADVVLVKSKLSDVVSAVKLSRATLRNIHQNLFWAFFYNVICIPLAAGAYTKALGISLNPMIGAAAMSLSSFCVVMNALRLNLVKLNKENTKTTLESDSEVIDQKEEKNMKISVKGMMCAHCEAHVKKALEALPGVESATASHEENLVVLTLNGDVSEEDIKKAVEDAGYEYAGII
jgi:Cu2+-exporting ATPase